MPQPRMTAKARATRDRDYNRDYYIRVTKPVRTHKRRKERYGLSEADFESLLVSQDKKCGICRIEEPRRGWCIDHCHSTGAIRGILCHRCNFLIGAAHDDPRILERAARYVNANCYISD